MTILQDYDQFRGVHWQTGSVRNFLAYRGFTAPHTAEPYSEALLLGVSGGIAVGYFTFDYEEYDPQCNILTRNTFDPLDKMLSRLGVVQNLSHTRSAERAETYLLDTLAEGVPAIVWADLWSLPYNALTFDERMWSTFPIVVYGYDREEDVVYIADRARVPLTISGEDLAAARGRIKKDKHRLLTLEAPDADKLATAVTAGIWDAIRLLTEKPPKGSKNNFGLRALQFWAEMLTQPKKRKSWQKEFPPGLAMYAGLKSAYQFAFLFGKGTEQDAERSRYAAFLDEAAVLLERPGLADAARLYRESGAAWRELPAFLLADEVAPFAETRRLMQQRHQLFLQEGQDALAQMREIDAGLDDLRRQVSEDFPLSARETEAYRERLAGQLLLIREREQTAVETLRETMA